MKNEILICEDHQYFKVPLISTFAFNGAEYWCPFCGFTGGIFESGISVKRTKQLEEKLKKYKEYSKEFLHATGVQVCEKTKWKGKWIFPIELPEKEKLRLKKIIDDWKYKRKL